MDVGYAERYFNRWLVSHYELEETPGVIHLYQSLGGGRINADEAKSLAVHSPRFVAMLIYGMSSWLGIHSVKDFITAAERGLLTRSVIERAMR